MEVMKYIIPAILCAFFVGTFALAQGTGTINQLDQWRRTVTGQITQNIANSTIKLTGYESSGDCLVTDIDGVVSTSSCGTGGGSGASSTIIKINGTISNTGVPTLDFGSGITVSESPTDEFNLSVPIYLSTSSSFTTGQVAFGTGPGEVGSIATGTLTETVTGLELSATRALLGGSAALSLTAGYEIPLSASTTQWLQAYASTTALTNSYIRGLFSASSPITYNSATGAFTFSTAGDWTGTFDGIEGSAYLARANHTGTQLASTISDFTAAVQSLSLGTTSVPTTGQVAFFTGARTLGSTATGTLTETATGLSLSGSPVVLGGSSVLTIDNGFTLASTTGLTNLYSFYDTPSTRITAGTGLSWSGNTLNAQPGGFSSSTPFTTGDLVFAGNETRLNTVATGTLTENVTGLELSATRGLVGGAAILNLTSGFVIPTSTLWTNVSDFYTTPSTRITAGANCSWVGNTFNCEGGSGGGGSLSTTTDIVGDGPAATVSYITTDVMFGGSASTTSEFLFDKDGSKFVIASSSAQATTTITNVNNSASIQFGIASSTQYAAPIVRGLHFAFQSGTQAIVNAVGTVTDFVLNLNFYLATGKNFFVGTTKWNNSDFIEGAAIASSTINATSLKAGTATAGYYLTASSTASGGMAWTQFLVNLATQVTGVLPIANGGTGTSTATLLYKPSAIQITSGSGAITTGDGKAYFRIPKEYAGMSLIDVDVAVTASSTSGYIEVQLARGRQASAGVPHTYSDMLSTAVTIDQNEYDSAYSATTTVINTSNDDVTDGDLIRIDVDRVGSGPSAVVIVQPVFGL